MQNPRNIKLRDRIRVLQMHQPRGSPFSPVTMLDRKTEQDAAARQRLLDIAALADAREGVRQGLEDVQNGRVQSAREFFDEFEAGQGLRR